MFKLINENKSCIVEAKTESAKRKFLNMGFSLIENKPANNDKKVDDIKKTEPKVITPKRRKAVSVDEGNTED